MSKLSVAIVTLLFFVGAAYATDTPTEALPEDATGKICGKNAEDFWAEFDPAEAGFSVVAVSGGGNPPCPTLDRCAGGCAVWPEPGEPGEVGTCSPSGCFTNDTGLTACDQGGQTFQCNGNRTIHTVDCASCNCSVSGGTGCPDPGVQTFYCDK